MLITLERPVRITPEQAVTDFFAAASHHVPHYRRMWLLLSSAGRESGPFRSFDDFRDHWKGGSRRWKASRGAGKFTPLKFEVEGFRADKSTGKATSRANYTVQVYLRDQRGRRADRVDPDGPRPGQGARPDVVSEPGTLDPARSEPGTP